MFRRLSRKSAKQASALKGQRPKRRGDGANQSDNRMGGFFSKKTLVSLAIGSLSIFAWSKRGTISTAYTTFSKSLFNIVVLAPRDWTIQITDSEGSPLNDDTRKEIFSMASNTLRTGSPSELEDLSKSIEGVGALEGIRIVRPQYQTIIITAGIRKPVLLIQAANKTRFLTTEGTVFGDASDQIKNPGGIRPSVLVTGVFENRASSLQLDHSARLITTVEEQLILQNAIALWRICSNQGLALRAISYQKFRGFDLKLDDDSEVMLGSAPFEYKVDKLVGIFAKLKKQGIAASRIELDYEGKAFIKERKL